MLQYRIMKKAFILLLVTFFSLTSDAQVKLGVKGGLDFTNMSLNKDFFAETNRTGFFLGPTLRVSLPVGGLGLDLSALYDQREGCLNYGEEDESSIKQRQFIFPLNVRWQYGTDLLGVFVFGGPQVGFNVSSDKDISLNSYKDVNWEWESSNFSFNLGFGFMILSQLQLSADYNIAFGKTGEFNFSDFDDELHTSNGRMHSCQVGLTYYF